MKNPPEHTTRKKDYWCHFCLGEMYPDKDKDVLYYEDSAGFWYTVHSAFNCKSRAEANGWRLIDDGNYEDAETMQQMQTHQKSS